jgi:hypothetical protein
MPEFYDAWDDQIPTPVVGTRYLYCLVCIILHNQSKAVNLALHTKNASSPGICITPDVDQAHPQGDAKCRCGSCMDVVYKENDMTSSIG